MIRELFQQDLCHQEEETNSLIRQHLLSLAPQSEKLSSTLEAARGKQLRPLLTYSVMDGFGADMEKVPCLAAVFESIHIASLLHDDVMITQTETM